MSTQRLSVGFSLLFALSGGPCLAAAQVGQGVVQFQGSVVEQACNPRVQGRVSFELTHCTVPAQRNNVSASQVLPKASASSARPAPVAVKLIAQNNRAGRYYDQRYTLVDLAGKPLVSGAYVITLTAP